MLSTTSLNPNPDDTNNDIELTKATSTPITPTLINKCIHQLIFKWLKLNMPKYFSDFLSTDFITHIGLRNLSV